MNYRSVEDIARLVRENSHRIPADVDLVVGIPRSGMLAATLLALTLNLKVTDLQGFLSDIPLRHGATRSSRFPDLLRPSGARHVLLVDDSISSGRALADALGKMPHPVDRQRITTCAVFATAASRSLVDLYFDVVEHPRAFEWNLMHRELLSSCCVDIDGVLCPDPRDDQNDDGCAYLTFLRGVSPSLTPSHPIGNLVTSRLERYRAETAEWLSANGIRYGALHMLDCPDAETRRRGSMHAPFKANVYRSLRDSTLFIESDPFQSREIARLSGKPVLCYRTQELVAPPLSLPRLRQEFHEFTAKILRALGRRMRAPGK